MESREVRVALRPATSVDVADAAGVSQPTVSRYLNGRPVSDGARTAIERAITDLDYRLNQSARSLVTNRTNIVGVVVGDMLNGYYA